MHLFKNLSLSMKFIPPVLGGTLMAVLVGGALIINEAKQATQEQVRIARTAFQVESRNAKSALTSALISKADSIGRFIAKTSPDLIISYDFTGLKSFQLEAEKDPDVVYAYFMKPDGSNMTQTKKPKDLAHVIEKKYPIKNEDTKLGYIVLGMSEKSVQKGFETSKKRIDEAIERVNSSATSSLNRLFTIMGFTTIAIIAIISGLIVVLFRRGMLSPLRETTELIKGLGEGHGDLTVTLPVKNNDEISQLRSAVNAFVASLRTMIKTIADDVANLQAASEQLDQLSQHLSDQSSQQRSQTTQVATAMNEMAATVQEVARNVSEAASAASTGREETANGKSVVQNTVSSIHHLSQEVDSAAQVIKNLEESSEKIGSVLDVINGIAEQTNLLALNAAIEAARAGEQGRGFAVVADEVRTLASRTHESTLEIREMIETVQSGSSNAVNAMKRGTDAAKSSVEQAELAGQSLESINGVVETINRMTMQIASAAEQQSATADEINKNITTIHQISEETEESANLTSRASSDLSGLTNHLYGLVKQFKI